MRTFGSYELIASLAMGGMSTLWLARSPGADGIVVLKRLLREHLGEADVLMMFLDEARLGELLRHPNLIRQYEHGVAEGEPFIVLEYLQGEDVRTIRRYCRKNKEKLGLDMALEIVIRVCEGLHAAHELAGPDGQPLNVVHRDVSPQNVVVTFDGVVKVLDFGIAKSRRRKAETKGGVLKGKVPYMAPEQIQTGAIDRRTDVYALGVMLYELTVGERPYRMQAPSEFGLMMAIVRGQITPPGAVSADYPPELESIVLRAMSPDPERRYATMAEVKADLESFRRKAGIAGGQALVAKWMASRFAGRIEELRQAKDPEELAAKILDAEKGRRAQGDDDEEVETAPKGAAAADRPMAGAAYLLSRRPLGAAVLATLTGRINETFDGAAVGRTIAESPLVVLDLAGVERVTSYGVREWLAMIDACKSTELWLARCSEPMIAQLSTIKGFSGHARVASLLLPFRCDACGTQAARHIDLELDAAELAGPRMAPVPCKQCGGDATFDDDVNALSFTRPWLGEAVSAPVRGALAVLARDSAETPPPIEKIVLGTETHVRIRSTADRKTRFRRLLDGVEGRLLIDVREATALDERTASDLARSLRALGPEVTTIEVRGATRELMAELTGARRIEITSRFAAGRCPKCKAARTVLMPAQGPPTPPPACARCGTTLDLLDPEKEDKAARPTGGTVPPSAPEQAAPISAPKSERAPPSTPRAPSMAPAARRKIVWLQAGLAVAGAALAVLVLAWAWREASRSVAPPGPSADPTASSSGGAAPSTAAPAHRDGEVIRRDGALEILVDGRGPTESDALAAARDRATSLLVESVRAELAADVREAIRVASRPDSPAEVSRRYVSHLGAGAAPERTEARLRSAPEGYIVAARFRVEDAAFRRAVDHFGAAEPFRGARVVPSFPLAAESGWLVVSAPPACPLRPGDRITGVGPTALGPLDRPTSVGGRSAELRVMRGETLETVKCLP